jgi:hypothetical protein
VPHPSRILRIGVPIELAQWGEEGWDHRRSTSHNAVAFALVFLVVIPKGDLLLFVAFTFFSSDFSPKIACQVQKPLNPLQANDIQVAF